MATSNKNDKTSTTRQTSAKRQASATSKAKSNSHSKPAAKKPAAKKSTSGKKAPPPRLDDGQRSLLAGIVILFLTAILTLSLLSPNQGQFTQWLSGLAGLAFGIGRVVIPLITGGIGIFLVLRGMEQEPELPWFRLLGAAVVFLVLLALASMVAHQREQGTYNSLYAVAAAGKGGGYLGSLLATALARLLGDLGTIATLMVVGLAGVVLAAGLSREQVAGWFEREPRPSTGAEPAERAVRINPGRETTANATPAARPPAADRRPEPQLRLIPEEGEAPARGMTAPAHDKPKRGKKEAPPPVFIEADRPATAVA
ncbi:MAG TPA: DNA translocase FtsK 4TM domain-containing protein, partial [Promineifilum sp.]|nr:DNA translocase FtsK 4TM domain-containing protein [Promineifilum sp.]